MLIGEVARQAGVSRDTVRLYTRLGLVPCTSRQAGSRLYADYDENAAGLIGRIKTAQSIGFTLSELRLIAAAGSPDDSQRRKLLAAKLDQVEDKRHQLGQISQFLRAPGCSVGDPAGQERPPRAAAELGAQAGHAECHDTARMGELGCLAGNPFKVGQPFFFVALGLAVIADAPGAPAEQPPGPEGAEACRRAGYQHGEREKAQGPVTALPAARV